MREVVFESGHRVTYKNQQQALAVLHEVGFGGVTPRELATRMEGEDVSGVNRWGAPLTLLRQAGVISALAEKREGHHVYVLPGYVNGRPTWAGYRHKGHCVTCTCGGEAS